MATVSQLGREIASVLNLCDLLKRSVALIRSSFAFHRVRIYLADRADGTTRLAAQASAEHALRVARRTSETLAALPLVDEKGRDIPKPTVSQGIAVFPDYAPTLDVLIDLADRMLYAAKDRGRDQVILYQPEIEQQYRLPLEGDE